MINFRQRAPSPDIDERARTPEHVAAHAGRFSTDEKKGRARIGRNVNGFNGGRYWDRTSDPYDVNVVL
ncbi:hypothetical protein, partial [Henriciella sp.]|uniref:hypothetical protein n=1 Tax=Henriciella sp. TaxID=1968823 RepID=UPI00262BC580